LLDQARIHEMELKRFGKPSRFRPPGGLILFDLIPWPVDLLRHQPLNKVKPVLSQTLMVLFAFSLVRHTTIYCFWMFLRGSQVTLKLPGHFRLLAHCRAGIYARRVTGTWLRQ
jgi:hypothetical protein